MLSLFARDRFGKPQLIAIAFLLAFLAQCLWVMARVPLLEPERAYLDDGRALWAGQGPARAGSRLVALAAGAGEALGSTLDAAMDSGETFARLGARLPFLGVALLLGGSLWYVARRLYGNTGGYIALALYCFAPALVVRGAMVNAAIVAVWGVFGVIFAAIAGAHTLYASLTWRQRAPRAVLLGTAMGLALAASPYALLALPLAFGFMMYLVPGKRAAALAVFGAALAVGALLLVAFSFSDPGSFGRHLNILPVRDGLAEQAASPALLLLSFAAVATYALWRRARYFGNAAPLLAATVFLAPSALGWTFYGLPMALPFVFVFIAGVFADLLETRRRSFVLAGLVLALLAHAAWGLTLLG